MGIIVYLRDETLDLDFAYDRIGVLDGSTSELTRCVGRFWTAAHVSL